MATRAGRFAIRYGETRGKGNYATYAPSQTDKWGWSSRQTLAWTTDDLERAREYATLLDGRPVRLRAGKEGGLGDGS